MLRASLAFLAGVLLAAPGVVRAADADLAGNWKVTLYLDGQNRLLWLLKVEKKDNKWTGEIVAAAQQAPKATLSDLTVKDDQLQFNVAVEKQGRLRFTTQVPADGAKEMLGSLSGNDSVIPVQLQKTTLTGLDPFEVNKDILATQTKGPEVVDAALELLEKAAEKKATAADVRSWATSATRAAQPYGRPFQLQTLQMIAGLLVQDDAFASIALEYARRAEKFLEPTDRPNVQIKTLSLLAEALRKAKKEDEAKEIEARVAKLPVVTPTKYAGRKGKSDRVILVELFTGAECPPCVGVDYAFDALAKTYQPSEAILLEYHLNIPRPDPLSNPGSDARARYYELGGTPELCFSGAPILKGGGSKDKAEPFYQQLVSVMDQFLERPAGAQLKATATRKGNKIEISAEASGVEKPGAKVRLRLALVEEEVAYKGSNGITTHHHVVRAMPGGPDGFAVEQKSVKQTASVDLDELKKGLIKYLDDTAKETPFPNKERPMELKNLRVVAFVQNDETQEVLQAVEVEIKGE